MMTRSDLDQFLVHELGLLGIDPRENLQAIKEAVLKLSDFYIQFPDRATPWQSSPREGSWALVAYLAYNHLLGHFRMTKLFDEIRRQGFLAGISTAVDFGSGSGVSFPFLSDFVPRIVSVEVAPQLFEVQRRYARSLGVRVEHQAPREFQKDFSAMVPTPKSSVLFLSFVLTEIRDLPPFAFDFEAVILVEPGLKNDTRRLMEMRSKLIERGYNIWAPCTHQRACPLLQFSERDWCHDKVKISYDGALAPLLAELPFDSRSAGFSYLLARRQEAKATVPRGRVLGEPLVENGKLRQMVCRGEAREFLSFLKKSDPHPPQLERGDLVEWSGSPELKGNELRGGGLRRVERAVGDIVPPGAKKNPFSEEK